MKKSTLLSFATAGAIVVTSAGTYAAWDTLTDDTTADITFRNPVTVTVNPTYELTEASSALDTLPTASGTVKFNVENPGDLANTLTITPIVTGGNSASVSDFNFEIIDSSENSKPKLGGNSEDGFVDKTLGTTTYSVTVTPKDASRAAVAGQEVHIQLTAELSKTASPTK